MSGGRRGQGISEEREERQRQDRHPVGGGLTLIKQGGWVNGGMGKVLTRVDCK